MVAAATSVAVMTRDELLAIRKNLVEMVTYRRSLGGFDTNADAILLALETDLALCEHAIEQMPKPKK